MHVKFKLEQRDGIKVKFTHENLAKIYADNAKVSELNSSIYAQIAKDWANKLGSTVDDTEYSSKYYALLAKQIYDNAVSEIEQKLQQINDKIQNVSIGMYWLEFNEYEWDLQDNGQYTYTVENVNGISGIYKSVEGLRILVSDVGIIFNEDNSLILIATEPFDGYVLGSINVKDFEGEDEDDNEFTDDELNDIVITDWDNVTP